MTKSTLLGVGKIYSRLHQRQIYWGTDGNIVLYGDWLEIFEQILLKRFEFQTINVPRTLALHAGSFYVERVAHAWHETGINVLVIDWHSYTILLILEQLILLQTNTKNHAID